MLKDIPYNTLKQDKRAYEIMLLRDQHDNTFTDIAKEYEINVTRVIQIYHKTKNHQIRLYINHISTVLEHENTSQIRKVLNEAYECYQDRSYACAYLEKKYSDILNEYRAGEPGMPVQFIKNMPPFNPILSEKLINRVIEMREKEKASFVKIGKELRMTQAKAKHTYDWFYHEKVLALVDNLQKMAGSREKQRAIWDYYFRRYRSPKNRYDELMKNQAFDTCKITD